MSLDKCHPGNVLQACSEIRTVTITTQEMPSVNSHVVCNDSVVAYDGR